MSILVKVLVGLAILLVLVALSLLIAGQMGLLSGIAPTDLGVRDGRLKPPSLQPNSVSSQADLYPEHPQRESARIAPFNFSGDGAAAMERLERILTQQPRTRVVFRNADYVRAESSTALFGFTDDIEFWLDQANSVIQVRSASRLGKLDFDANRKRIKALRAAFGG